jgi:hypothetical protein
LALSGARGFFEVEKIPNDQATDNEKKGADNKKYDFH